MIALSQAIAKMWNDALAGILDDFVFDQRADSRLAFSQFAQ